MPDTRTTYRERLNLRAQMWEYRALIASAGLVRGPFLVWVWTHWWVTRTPRMRGVSRIRLHGRTVQVNTGFAYPAFMRRWPRYNLPLVALVQAVRRHRASSLSIVDVGAAVGDTVLLLAEQDRENTDSYICVEPDPEFGAHLKENVAHLPNVETWSAMLSDTEDAVPALIRTHSGTASPQGHSYVAATTLDAVIGRRHVDVVKIDTDGFDGKVLAGAHESLANSAPAVIFEWHPILLAACGQSVTTPFDVLTGHGYRTFLWFNKHGEFSHVDSPHDADHTAKLEEICLLGEAPEPDWHYDVVALPHHLQGAAADVLAFVSRLAS